MNALENNEILNGLLEQTKENDNTWSELTEVLLWKSFDKEKFYDYLCQRLNSSYDSHKRYNYRYRNSGEEDHIIFTHRENLRQDVWKLKYGSSEGISRTLSAEEVKTILSDLNDYLCQNSMDPLRANFDQDIPYFRASSQDKEYYLKWIEDRSLSVDEYEKMQWQIAKYWSILSRSNRRWREFGWWGWSVILSLTTGKVYDVEWSWESALEEDYKAYRYYTSRSGASAAWNLIAWKWSLIYMPNSRMDVTYPELYFRDINWLNMTMCTSRWVIDESLPTIIKSWKIDLWVDAVFLSQKDHLAQWNARDLINTIETKWENLKDWPIYTYKVKYFDENLEEKEKVFTFKTNMDLKDLNFRGRWKEFFWINRWFDVEQTWSFIDKIVWIRKYKWKYVRLWQFGLVKEVFDEHPDSYMDMQYYEDIEIWNWNEILHNKERIQPEYTHDLLKKFNWWIVWDNFAYKNVKSFHNFSEYDLKDLCAEHGIHYWEELVNDDVYHLVFEDDVSKYNEMLKVLWMANMEFEYYIPKTIFEKYSIDYWKEFLREKLEDKALKNIDSYSFPEEVQTEIALNYLKLHKDTVFTLQDSYDSWNCHPWTDRFLKTFNLPDKISGKELLKRKDLWKMLTIYDFRKIFVKKALRQSIWEGPDNMLRRRKVRRRKS